MDPVAIWKPWLCLTSLPGSRLDSQPRVESILWYNNFVYLCYPSVVPLCVKMCHPWSFVIPGYLCVIKYFVRWYVPVWRGSQDRVMNSRTHLSKSPSFVEAIPPPIRWAKDKKLWWGREGGCAWRVRVASTSHTLRSKAAWTTWHCAPFSPATVFNAHSVH